MRKDEPLTWADARALQVVGADEEIDGNGYLPGFEYLQRYYVVQRQGEDVGVPVLECTDEELYAKAALYRSQSRKLVAHADEIERYIQWRASQHERAANE